jgi:hypothetical protein
LINEEFKVHKISAFILITEKMEKKAIKVPILVMLMFLVLFSCKKDSRNDNAVADVYVKSILVDGEPFFGLVHYVVGYEAMTSVTVDPPSGTTEPLTAYDSGKTIYYIEPTLALGTYSTTPPAHGTYSYLVTFDDAVEKTVTDELGATYLLPASIISIAKTSDNQSVRLTWEAVSGVEYYQLSISKDGNVLYTSQLFIPPTGNTIDIPLSYIPSYNPGTYSYQLDAIDYDSLETGKLQAISSASVSIDL